MSSTKVTSLFFILPLIISTLNMQGWATLYLSDILGRIIAYSNIGLLLIGFIILIRKKSPFSRSSSLWLHFFILYYTISFFSSINNNYPYTILYTLPTIIFFLGFLSFLRFNKHILIYEKLITSLFLIANILLIIFVQFNIDYDYYNIDLEINLDRAQGVYGDANNAALVCILGFIFINQFLKPHTKKGQVIKVILLVTSFYALFLTFSTTGFIAFIIVLALLNYKRFKGKKSLLIPLILIPTYFVLLNLNSLTAGLNLNVRQKHKIENIVNLVSLNFDKVDSSGRKELAENVMRYVYKNPILGNGLNFGIDNRAHNTFLSIWVDSGIIPIIFFIIMIIVFFKNTIIYVDINQRFFCLSILITLCLFMLNLQSVINQPYLMTIFVYLGYVIDNNKRQKIIQ